MGHDATSICHEPMPFNMARSCAKASSRTCERYVGNAIKQLALVDKLTVMVCTASLEQQKWRFQRDWAYFQSMKLSPSRFGAPPEESSEWMFNMFRFTWLLVNTRSFYWDYPTAAVETSKHQKKRKTATGSKQSSLPTDECMALVPFIDLFNHSYVGESVRKLLSLVE